MPPLFNKTASPGLLPHTQTCQRRPCATVLQSIYRRWQFTNSVIVSSWNREKEMAQHYYFVSCRIPVSVFGSLTESIGLVWMRLAVSSQELTQTPFHIFGIVMVIAYQPERHSLNPPTLFFRYVSRIETIGKRRTIRTLICANVSTFSRFPLAEALDSHLPNAFSPSPPTRLFQPPTFITSSTVVCLQGIHSLFAP